tara:strand:- start:11211 stop:11489 length:279 start_codon:yes stop_codon:yes gene_type:complete
MTSDQTINGIPLAVYHNGLGAYLMATAGKLGLYRQQKNSGVRNAGGWIIRWADGRLSNRVTRPSIATLRDRDYAVPDGTPDCWTTVKEFTQD